MAEIGCIFWSAQIFLLLKGIGSDSNIFYNIIQKILTKKKKLFSKFSWFKLYVYKFCMIMCIDTASWTTVWNWVHVASPTRR